MAVKKRKLIEAEYGKPMRQILIELFEKHGSQTQIAQELGVNQSTISDWVLRCGLREVRRLEPIDQSLKGELNGARA